MNIHEYQGKEILGEHGVAVQKGIVAETVEEALAAYDKISDNGDAVIIKAQIHAGGRGKGGGVKLAKNREEVKKYASDILGMMLKTPQTPGGLEGEGKKVHKVLIAEDAYKPDFESCSEYYIAILTDRDKEKNVIIFSTEGGMDIEQVTEETPEKIQKAWIDPAIGMQSYIAREVAFGLNLSGESFKQMTKFITDLYNAYVSSDATLIEINPCIVTGNGDVLAVDTKVTIDDNALYRRKGIAKMRDISEEDPTEVEAKKHGLNFINLDGNVGCMVNGAGLAMATMDIIKLSGGDPANFLDVGGSADAKRVEEAFRIILKDPQVEAILVNIFGGIVRCDRVARGIVDAYNNIGNIDVPIIIRLQGTNADKAKEIIEESGLKVKAVTLLQEAADEVRKAIA